MRVETEHVFTLGTEIRQNYPDYPDPWDEEARVADAVTKLAECKSRGITTIVDPTVIGLGRYIPRIQRINAQVDINIVVATGICKTALLPRWNYTHITDDVLPALRGHGVDEAQITAMLVRNPARYFTGGQE